MSAHTYKAERYHTSDDCRFHTVNVIITFSYLCYHKYLHQISHTNVSYYQFIHAYIFRL